MYSDRSDGPNGSIDLLDHARTRLNGLTQIAGMFDDLRRELQRLERGMRDWTLLVP